MEPEELVVTPQAWICMALCFVTLPARVANAQEPDPRERFRFAVDVDQVALDVVVTNRRGRFEKNLKAEDFQVLEEGVPQRVTFFTSSFTPVTVLLLLDSSPSVRTSLNAIKLAANRFVTNLNAGDKAKIILFHEVYTTGPAFTDDELQLIALISSMRPRGRRTILYDSILRALEDLEPIDGRKVLLLLSDGTDAGSKASLEDVIERARRSNAVIYTIGFMGWTMKKGMFVEKDLLTKIAATTGGRAIFPQDDEELGESFEEVKEELHRQYRMAFVPSSDQGDESVWRKIEIRVPRKSKSIIRTRLGYYTRPKKKP